MNSFAISFGSIYRDYGNNIKDIRKRQRALQAKMKLKEAEEEKARSLDEAKRTIQGTKRDILKIANDDSAIRRLNHARDVEYKLSMAEKKITSVINEITANIERMTKCKSIR